MIPFFSQKTEERYAFPSLLEINGVKLHVNILGEKLEEE